MVATKPPQTHAAQQGRRSTAAKVLDGLVMAGVLGLLVFPVLARLAAGTLPIAPAPASRLPGLASERGRGAPRDLPVGRTTAATPAGPRDLEADATALLGRRAGKRLIAIVGMRSHDVVEDAVGGTLGFAPYPYRYRPLQRILPARLAASQAERATDLAARLILLSLPHGATFGGATYPNAAPAAFALLDLARAHGACAPQLDLLLIVAADDQPRDDVVAAEGGRAERTCPGEVTPGWMLGEYQSQRALLASTPVLPTDPVDERRLVPRPFATFRALERRFPGSAAAWSGEADADVRLAYQLPPDQPFRARRLYAAALARYQRAARLGPEPGLEAGMARALAGLGRPADAVAAQRRASRGARASAPTLAPLVEYLETAHRFAEAAGVAARLPSLPLAPANGTALYPYVPAGTADHPLQKEDAFGPISLGNARLTPLTVSLQPAPGGADASVQDYSFIPAFRPLDGVTGSNRWCPDWSRRRDLILAGRPREALVGFPQDFTDLRPNGYSNCTPPDGPQELAGIADLELGDVAAARKTDGLDALEYAREDLWRWAGDLPRAERAAREWVRLAPGGAGPRVALGEIEFLRRRFDAAAADFGASARAARDEVGVWTANEAEALLKRGTALAAAGRPSEGLATLVAADDTASRAYGLQRRQKVPDEQALAQLAWLSYFARVQAGDAQREGGALRAAADSYAAAREREPELITAKAPFRSAHLDNNDAIVELALGRLPEGEAAALRATAGDPSNPAFLMTRGFADERAGHHVAAIGFDRAALAADPTAYPAANDLGVLLARRGDDQGAVDALRRAVGANRRYALGWFNLGVVLGGMGPLHFAAAQGALARAIALDASLRDRKRELTIDERTYRTGLDISKPLPRGWSFAASQRNAPARTAGFAAVLLLALGLGRTFVSSGNGRAAAEKWLDPLARSTLRIRALPGTWPLAVGVVATVVVFAWPLARHPGGGVTAAACLLLGLLALIGVVMRSRVAVARRAGVADSAQSTWPPGVVFGLGATAAGLPWAPLPVVRSRDSTASVHWAAPAALGVIGLALTGLSAWLDVPLTRGLAVAALVMAASLLTPVKPLDGAAVSAAGARSAILAGLGLAALLLLGLL
jgi:tetratricopeptide (TPR) repeat protein